MKKTIIFCLLVITLSVSCQSQTASTNPDNNMVRLITLDPGHFHAALVQKSMYDGVDPVVHVYAPAGDDVKLHLDRINAYNTRAEEPTRWKEVVYTGDDFLIETMMSFMDIRRTVLTVTAGIDGAAQIRSCSLLFFFFPK